jgi:cobalamin synthase
LELWSALFLLVASSCSIILLAPFDHPSMHYSPEEIMACAISSRKRLLILIVVVIGGYLLKYAEISYGITLGVSTTAIMLVSARITSRREKDE